MKLLLKWRRGAEPGKSEAGPCRDQDNAESASGLDELQKRLNDWSNLWSQESDPAMRTAAQDLVAERLTQWIEHCFGRNAEGSIRGKGHPISLATSTPIFTAFLGRRATRELSRRVLQDI